MANHFRHEYMLELFQKSELSNLYELVDKSHWHSKGQFGAIYRCIRKNSANERFVIKIIPHHDKMSIGAHWMSHEEAAREFTFLKRLSMLKEHIQTTQLIDPQIHHVRGELASIILMADHGISIGDLINESNIWNTNSEQQANWPEAANLVYQVAWTIRLMHKADIIHRDLKLQNIMRSERASTTTTTTTTSTSLSSPTHSNRERASSGGLPPSALFTDSSEEGLPAGLPSRMSGLPPVPPLQGLPKALPALPSPTQGEICLPRPPSTMTTSSPGVLPSSRKKSLPILPDASRYIYTLIDFGLSAKMTLVGKHKKAVKDRVGVGTSSYMAPELESVADRDDEEGDTLFSSQNYLNTTSTYGSADGLAEVYENNMYAALALGNLDIHQPELMFRSPPNSPHRSDNTGSETGSHTRRGRSGTMDSWMADMEGKNRTLNPFKVLDDDESDDDTTSSEDREREQGDGNEGDQALYDEKGDSFALGSTLYQLVIGNKLDEQNLDRVRARVRKLFDDSAYQKTEWEGSPHHLILNLIESDKNQRLTMRQVCEHKWITSHLLIDEKMLNEAERAFVSNWHAISSFEDKLPDLKDDVHRLKESDLRYIVNMHDDSEASYNERTSHNHSKSSKRKNKERKREAGQGQGEQHSMPFGTPPSLRSVNSIDSFSSKGSTRSRASSRKSLHSLKREDSGNLGGSNKSNKNKGSGRRHKDVSYNISRDGDTDDGFYFDEVDQRSSHSRGTSVASHDSFNDAFSGGYPMTRTLSAGNVSPGGTPHTPTSGSGTPGTPGNAWNTQPYPLVKSRSANAGTFLNLRRHNHTAVPDEFIQFDRTKKDLEKLSLDHSGRLRMINERLLDIEDEPKNAREVLLREVRAIKEWGRKTPLDNEGYGIINKFIFQCDTTNSHKIPPKVKKPSLIDVDELSRKLDKRMLYLEQEMTNPGPNGLKGQSEKKRKKNGLRKAIKIVKSQKDYYENAMRHKEKKDYQELLKKYENAQRGLEGASKWAKNAKVSKDIAQALIKFQAKLQPLIPIVQELKCLYEEKFRQYRGNMMEEGEEGHQKVTATETDSIVVEAVIEIEKE